jgi:hypothetical protein
VELAPLGPHKYHLKVFCKKAGVFTKVLEALCGYNAQVTSLSTITFYGYAESVFSIEVSCSRERASPLICSYNFFFTEMLSLFCFRASSDGKFAFFPPVCIGERGAGRCDGGAEEPFGQHCRGPK